MKDPELVPPTIRPATPGTRPDALVDAGGEPWSVVGDIVARHLDELTSGSTIEVLSGNPDHRLDVMSWCRTSHNDLLQIVIDGGRTWFWIRKR